MSLSPLRLLILVALVVFSSYGAVSQVTTKKSSHVCVAHSPQEKALLGSVKDGDLASLKLLLSQGANPNAKDDCGNSAIAFAAGMLRPDLLKELIASGADVNVIDGDFDEPPVLRALDRYEKDDEIYDTVKLLIKAGADVNLKGKYGDPPLTAAVMKEMEKVVALLIAAGANINAGKEEGRTAYSYAAEAGNKKLKSMLLAAGADPNIGVEDYEMRYGSSAIIIASADRRTDVVEALLSKGTDVNTTTPGEVAALMRVGAGSTFDVLLAAGANINMKDNAGFTALMWTAYSGDVEHVKRLIAAGADVNAITDDGMTALDMAKTEVKEILIQAGARRGHNPLPLRPQ